MPYVSLNDRACLDPLVAALHEKIMLLCSRRDTADGIENTAWGYMHFVAAKALKESGLDAALQYRGERRMRYFLIRDQAGIALNIACELFDRMSAFGIIEKNENVLFDLRRIGNDTITPDDAGELDSEVGELLRRIAVNAGPQGYNYDGAYGGLVNYSMTELMPRVLKSVRDAQGDRFESFDIILLVEFWLDVAWRLYCSVARSYEDAQKEKNGDVRVYGDVFRWLRE